MERRYYLLLGISFFVWIALSGQSDDRVLKAYRVAETMQIDGILNEQIWRDAVAASDFIQTEPIPGTPSTFQTEVRFAYDNQSLFIAARMHDPEPEKILREFSLRDQVANADNFSVFLDTYKSGLNGFLFTVTASGVQVEAIVSNQEDDTNWNCVWDSRTRIDSLGWTAEFRIPLSSIRFPQEESQTWRIQFGREIRRFRESAYWSPIDPTISGWAQQSGLLEGIENITSPIRLFAIPYLSSYLNTSYDPDATGNRLTAGTAYSAGLDVKYGINDAFTLDMTLIPDFGQVISDRQVLNLTPFEVFFEENRPFFTEGTELFDKGRLFYSRRVGGRPIHFYDVYGTLREGERIVSNPETSQLYNATKISGRTVKGTGLGFFNAIVGREEAILRDASGNERAVETNPVTNYNAIVFDQNLPNNSYVSLMNTNVYRLGDDRDANVTGTFFNLRSKNQEYELQGSGALSRLFLSDGVTRGHTYNLSAGKVSGMWTYGVSHGVESDKYNPNDLGFLYSPNEVFYGLSAGYVDYTPANQALQQVRVEVNSVYSRLYKPDVFTDYNLSIEQFTMWKSRFAFGWNARLEPFETYDYFEPRTTDFSRYLTWPENYTAGAFVSSDYRKPFAYDVRASYRWFDALGRRTTSLSLSPRVRFSDKLSVFPSSGITWVYQEPGYVNRNKLAEVPDGLQPSDILMGIRDRAIIENAISARYIFSSTIGINLRVRHYWDKVVYTSFGQLGANGFPQELAFDGRDISGKPVFDTNVNIFNVDMQFNWRFAPGSDLVMVWKNQVFTYGVDTDSAYFDNLESIFGTAQTNNFSIRLLYFLDYLYLFPEKSSTRSASVI